jgi:2-C-methyl-D-erythritol 4-phosphate cytidylyltransferase
MTEAIHMLIPAGGVGLRAGAGGPKQYALLAGEPMLAHTLRAVARVAGLSTVLLCVAAEDPQAAGLHLDVVEPRLVIAPCAGAQRADTVGNGLRTLLNRGARLSDWVLVHDAARCLVDSADVERLIAACRTDAVGGLLAQPLADTLKTAREGRSLETLSRADKWLAQTPQMFRIGVLLDALNACGGAVTDEASAIESLGLEPLLVEARSPNFKVTYPQDMALAEALLHARSAQGNR